MNVELICFLCIIIIASPDYFHAGQLARLIMGVGQVKQTSRVSLTNSREHCVAYHKGKMCLNSANDESMKMQCSEVLEIFTPNSTVNSNSVYIIIAHFGNRYFLLTKIEAPMVQIKMQCIRWCAGGQV